MEHSRLLLRTPTDLRLADVAQEPEGALLLQAVPSPAGQPPGTQLASYRVRAAVDHDGKQDTVARWAGCQLGDYEWVGSPEQCPCFVGRVRLRLRFNSTATGSSLEQVGGVQRRRQGGESGWGNGMMLELLG